MKKFTVKLTVLLVCLLPLVVGSCKKADEEKILARVDGEPIYEGDVMRRLKAVHGEVDKSKIDPTRWQMMTEAALESEILEKLLLKEAVSKGIEASSEEVDSFLNRSRKLLGEAKFNEMLKERNASEQEYRVFLKQRLLIDKLKKELLEGIEIDEDTIENYYEGHKQTYSLPESVRLEILIVENPENANEIYKMLKEDTDFETFSKEQSEGEKKVTFRRTRWMPYDAIPLNIQLKVKGGVIGTILEPVQSENTTQIIKVVDKRSARALTFEEAKESIKNSFLRRRQQDILDTWYETAKQKVTIEYLRE